MQPEMSQPKKSKRWFWIAIPVIALITTTGFLLKNIFGSPAQGTVQTPKLDTARQSTAQTTYVLLKGHTFTLEYPSTYKPTPMGNSASYGDLDNFLLNTSSIAGSDHLAISVQARFTSLGESSSYRFRQQRPELYSQTIKTIAGGTGYIMTKTQDGYEQTVFLPHQDKLATIALTSPQADVAAKASVMDHILTTFHWNP